MYCLGFNEGHTSTAALMGDGRILACISEERLSRKKNQFGFPVKAARRCLEMNGVDIEDVKAVVLSSVNAPPLLPDEEGYASWATYGPKFNWFLFLARLRDVFKFSKTFDSMVAHQFGHIVGTITRQQRLQTIQRLLGVKANKVRFVDHHYAHALSAIFGSGWSNRNLLAITIDGEGDLYSAKIGTWKSGRYTLIASSDFSESMGHFYSAITGILSMKRGEHEYKVMGLAPYASGPDMDRAYEVLQKEIWFDPFTLKIRTRVHAHIMMKKLKKKMEQFRFDHVAGATQRITEDLLCSVVKAAVAKTGIHDVVVAGGTFMNIKGNHDIAKLEEVDHFYVTPSCGDDSLAIGACYSAFLEHEPGATPAPLESLYLGDEPDVEGIEEKAKARGFKITKCENISKAAAELLANGDIVARCSGRMEFGARALGNRSILANPALPDVVERINRAIKHRDFWMPFAPVIMADKADRYIADMDVLAKTQADYMMIAFESTPFARKHIRGTLHPYDKTMRPQCLTKEKNPGCYAIIEEFSKLTGQYALLNTSFNIHGYPIVRSTENALDVLEQSGLTHLVIEDYLVEKQNGV